VTIFRSNGRIITAAGFSHGSGIGVGKGASSAPFNPLRAARQSAALPGSSRGPGW
jgi:hypothetical protein